MGPATSHVRRQAAGMRPITGLDILDFGDLALRRWPALREREVHLGGLHYEGRHA
jgi:hypothetical protein